MRLGFTHTYRPALQVPGTEDHMPIFEQELILRLEYRAWETIVRAIGNSKKEAKAAAASAGLRWLVLQPGAPA